ncbi:MAG: putative bifunctional diguanylate cyclase/phosphodiesterase [Bacillota bacterium]
MEKKIKDYLLNNKYKQGLMVVNQTGKILGLDKPVADIFEANPQDIINKDINYFFNKEIVLDDCIDQNKEIVELEIKTVNHENIKVNCLISSFYLGEDKLYQINFRKIDNSALEKQLSILTKFIEKDPNPVFRIAEDGDLLYANPIGETIVSELKQQENNTEPDTWEKFIAGFINDNQSKKIKIETSDKIFLFQVVPINSDNSFNVYGKDITKLVETKSNIEKLINYDFLTGLPNRSLFSERLKEDLKIANQNNELVAVLFMDLDNFKKVNDSLGHEVGDKLLAKVSQKLRNLVEENDFLARLSGDEFGVIINGRRNINEISKLLEKFINEFSQPFDIISSDGKKTEIFMTLSIGAAIYPNDSKNLEQLIKNSETAKNKVKENGKNHYRFYSDEMNEEVLEDLELEAKLRHAIDNDEFVLHYQPQIDLNKGQVFGVEALIRWKSEELGLVSPGRFIPLAERTGLIIPIGDWVLKEACLEAKEFHKAGYSDLKMGINLSARQFGDNKLIEKISTNISETELNPAALELEITESVIMQNIQESVSKLIELKELGVNFSIDDFGTGYSSLSYLKEFPIETLKIDRSFVDQVPGDRNDTAIVKAIIDLAHNLNLNVIAEGVENLDHVQFLEDNNCDRIQGYYFGRPMSKEELIEFLNNESWKTYCN